MYSSVARVGFAPGLANRVLGAFREGMGVYVSMQVYVTLQPPVSGLEVHVEVAMREPVAQVDGFLPRNFGMASLEWPGDLVARLADDLEEVDEGERESLIGVEIAARRRRSVPNGLLRRFGSVLDAEEVGLRFPQTGPPRSRGRFRGCGG